VSQQPAREAELEPAGLARVLLCAGLALVHPRDVVRQDGLKQEQTFALFIVSRGLGADIMILKTFSPNELEEKNRKFWLKLFSLLNTLLKIRLRNFKLSDPSNKEKEKETFLWN
jgi:hypothetical protein